jgi:hypothetical protein
MTQQVKATGNTGLPDDHDPNDIGQKIIDKTEAERSQEEGPAAYAPHHEDEGIRSHPDRAPAKKKTGEF